MKYLPDINVWLALAWAGHQHSEEAWRWFEGLESDRLLFCRMTQIGLLRLLTTEAVMGGSCAKLGGAWEAFDRLREDPRIEMSREPASVDELFRAVTVPHKNAASPKALADSYLIGLCQALQARLVTLDRALATRAGRADVATVLL